MFVNSKFKPNEIEELNFKDRSFLRLKQVNIRSNKAKFRNRFIKRVRPRDEGLNLSDLYCKRIVYLFA